MGGVSMCFPHTVAFSVLLLMSLIRVSCQQFQDLNPGQNGPLTGGNNRNPLSPKEPVKAPPPLLSECLRAGDIALIVDSSTSMTWANEDNWKLIIDFLSNIVGSFANEKNITNFAVITFEDKASLRFRLGDYNNQQVIEYLNRLKHDGGDTNTGHAFEVAVDEVFKDGGGNRNDVQDIIILITDGHTTAETYRLDPAIKKAKGNNIRIFVVAINEPDINIDEMKRIASLPTETHLFNVNQFEKLKDILHEVVNQTCEALAADLEGPGCPGGKADITFVVDGSGSIRESNPADGSYDNWILLKQFLMNFVRLIDISPDAVLTSLVLFANQAQTIYDFQSSMSVNSTLDYISTMPYPEGNTNTTGGLSLAGSLYSHKYGDRSGVADIVIIITDGKSTWNRPQTIPTAERLRGRGVRILVVGITNKTDEEELRLMSSKPQVEGITWWKTADFRTLQGLLSVVYQEMCSYYDDCSYVDVGILLDTSGSIGHKGPENYELMKNFTVNLVSRFPMAPDKTWVGVIKFSNNAEWLIDITTEIATSKYDAINYIRRLGMDRGKTNITGALKLFCQTVSLQLMTSTGRRAARYIAILITDGQETEHSSEELQAEAKRCRLIGVEIFVVGITNQIDVKQLEQIASDPDSRHVFTVDEFSRLVEILNPLFANACAQSDLPTVGTLPPCAHRVELVFVLDASGSIKQDNFDKAKAFIAGLIGTFDIHSGFVKIALVTFADRVQTIFGLTDAKNIFSAQDATMDAEYMHGQTDTAQALKYVYTEIFNEVEDDPSVMNMMLILTDGGSTNKAETFANAIEAKRRGIHITVMGIGDWIDEQELRAIASFPHSQNLILVPRYDILRDFSDIVRNMSCNNKNECESNPCTNGGTCVDGIESYTCLCPDRYGGSDCSIECNEPSDIVLTLDNSGSITKQNFYKLMEFVKFLVNDLPIGSGMRLGLQTFSTEEKVYFNLNDFNTKMQYMNAMTLPFFYGGTTNTARALAVLREMFTLENGDRPEVGNVALIVTDGNSNNMAETWQEAIKTRATDIQLMTVGVGSNIRMDELEAISNAPAGANVFTVREFDELFQIKDLLVGAICNQLDECLSNPCRNGGQCINIRGGYRCECPEGYTGTNCERGCSALLDLVFIIDRSGSIRKERFNEVQEYIVSIIKEIEVSPTKVRIGVITFDNSPEIVAYLKDFESQQDIITAVKLIQHTGGRTNIYDAIKLLKEQMYLTANGERPNAPNICILFTDGNSNIKSEDTIPMAVEAKLYGIHMISVSVGTDLNMIELQGIASFPTSENIFSVERFDLLPYMVEEVLDATCNSKDECQSNPCQAGGTCIDGLGLYYCACRYQRTGASCERVCRRQIDIVFLLDLSGSVDSVYFKIINFARRVVQGLEFNADQTRVAVVTFATEATVKFHLNTFQNKLDILQAMAFTNLHGKTNTQGGFLTVRDQVLVRSRGDRRGVPNVVILVTDGGSNVDNKRTVDRANDLKSDGASIYVAAIGDMIDMEEINALATYPPENHIVKINGDDTVDRAADDILDKLCETS